MKSRTLRSDLIMLLAAFIWGSTFVAQRIGMNYIGPFLFNAIRFFIGAVVVLPFVLKDRHFWKKLSIKHGFILGLVLFTAIGFQQWGIVYTTAGKAGFITGLYVVFVPLLGMFMRKKSHRGHIIGALLALLGLYLLSVKHFSMEKGDFLVFMGAVAWTFHVQLIDTYVKDTSPFVLAFTQFITTSLFSFVLAVFTEKINMVSMRLSVYPLLYAGVLSSGIAYTLQVIAQKESHPSHAAIILSLESVFAALSGWVVLGEHFTPREIIGALLMLSGMIFSQMYSALVSYNTPESV